MAEPINLGANLVLIVWIFDKNDRTEISYSHSHNRASHGSGNSSEFTYFSKFFPFGVRKIFENFLKSTENHFISHYLENPLCASSLSHNIFGEAKCRVRVRYSYNRQTIPGF